MRIIIIFLKTNANIFIVDWWGGTRAPKFLELLHYGRSCTNTRIVGKRLADYLVYNKLDLNKVTCIGYSLGIFFN